MDSVYCTAFNILTSFYNVKIDFSKVEPVTDENGSIVGDARTPYQRITLPVALAKELAQRLAASIHDYEEKFGEVIMFPADNGGK